LVNLKKQFGIRVRQIRDEADKTQEDFAELVGISVDFLSLIERGWNAPSFKKLETDGPWTWKTGGVPLYFRPQLQAAKKENRHKSYS